MSLRVPARTQDPDIESCSASSAGAAEKYMPPDLALHHTQPQEFLRYMRVSDFESSLAHTTYRDPRQKWSRATEESPYFEPLSQKSPAVIATRITAMNTCVSKTKNQVPE